ncbi:MAG: RNA methyltransferase substrate-binding domain-containing protein, partial [Dethiobacteria bacterium]
MSPLEVRSPQNQQVKEFIRLAESRRYRRRAGKLALEGPHLIREALAAGIVPQTVFLTRAFMESRAGGELADRLPRESRRLLLSDQLFHRMARTESPQGVAAIVPFREASLSDLLADSLSLA